MGYFDWHEAPGYWADITRHFDPADRLLDVGCGTGWLAEHFSDYTGIDGSPEAVRLAQERGRNVSEADVARPLPFADADFDAVVIKDVLEHLTEPQQLVAEVHRVLRGGGLCFASSPDAQRWMWNDYTHRRPHTRTSFRLMFSDAGFEVRRVGYESVAPGVGLLAARTRRKRRPRVFTALALLPFHRRNVWVLARKPAAGRP